METRKQKPIRHAGLIKLVLFGGILGAFLVFLLSFSAWILGLIPMDEFTDIAVIVSTVEVPLVLGLFFMYSQNRKMVVGIIAGGIVLATVVLVLLSSLFAPPHPKPLSPEEFNAQNLRAGLQILKEKGLLGEQWIQITTWRNDLDHQETTCAVTQWWTEKGVYTPMFFDLYMEVAPGVEVPVVVIINDGGFDFIQASNYLGKINPAILSTSWTTGWWTPSWQFDFILGALKTKETNAHAMECFDPQGWNDLPGDLWPFLKHLRLTGVQQWSQINTAGETTGKTARWPIGHGIYSPQGARMYIRYDPEGPWLRFGIGNIDGVPHIIVVENLKFTRLGHSNEIWDPMYYHPDQFKVEFDPAP